MDICGRAKAKGQYSREDRRLKTRTVSIIRKNSLVIPKEYIKNVARAINLTVGLLILTDSNIAASVMFMRYTVKNGLNGEYSII
jgi:hypothetical protein